LALTKSMLNSGDTVDLSEIPGIKVDKHSTGGIGDKTTIIVAPIAAACGVPIAKMSGRGLGFTGGTVDKLESIPGFQTILKSEQFMEQVRKIGISVIGQSANIAPADKKIYALRDVTATVENLSLITSSIMSKKLASGSDAIVLDVKCGRGAFAETEEQASMLAGMMVEIGNAAGKRTIAAVTDMNNPLGRAVGNSVEIIEAIETLKGQGPEDISELSVILAGLMIFCGGVAATAEEGKGLAKEAIKSGRALRKFGEFITAQGGNPEIIYDYSLFKQPKIKRLITTDRSGYVASIDAKAIGISSQLAGGGRTKKEDTIDLSAGIYLFKKINEYVEKGEAIAEVFGDNEQGVQSAVKIISEAYEMSFEKVQEKPLIKKIIE
ncbi:MAG: thymidine phosphorylase, partial [Eubacteriales bacterium]|nr:thymidine phosphorylase [Eubacteriales bacterium]